MISDWREFFLNFYFSQFGVEIFWRKMKWYYECFFTHCVKAVAWDSRYFNHHHSFSNYTCWRVKRFQCWLHLLNTLWSNRLFFNSKKDLWKLGIQMSSKWTVKLQSLIWELAIKSSRSNKKKRDLRSLLFHGIIRILILSYWLSPFVIIAATLNLDLEIIMAWLFFNKRSKGRENTAWSFRIFFSKELNYGHWHFNYTFSYHEKNRVFFNRVFNQVLS